MPEDLAALLAACEREPVPLADLDGVVIQDYQFLLQHCAFVKLAMQDPTFADLALAALTGWLNSSRSDSRAVHGEWQDILTQRDWRRALARDAHGDEIRRASPVTTVLPTAVRDEVLVKVRAMKQERWQAENNGALESSNQYAQERGLPIRGVGLHELVDVSRLLVDLKEVLRDGETVPEFIESAVRRAIELRRSLA